MDQFDLRLRPLVLADEHEARAAHAELLADGFEFLLTAGHGTSPDDWPAYLAALELERVGRDLPPGRVPATFLVAEVAGTIVGRVSVRHRLTPVLERVGGHIGYAVRTAHRRRGHATSMLRQALERAADVGIATALATCDEENATSAHVIERCGGTLVDVVPHPETGLPTRRYRVPTSGTPDA